MVDRDDNFRVFNNRFECNKREICSQKGVLVVEFHDEVEANDIDGNNNNGDGNSNKNGDGDEQSWISRQSGSMLGPGDWQWVVPGRLLVTSSVQFATNTSQLGALLHKSFNPHLEENWRFLGESE